MSGEIIRDWNQHTHTTQCIIDNKALLYSKGTPVQYSALTPYEKDFKQSGYKCMYNRCTLMNARK